jgi:hypothetical protein
LSRSTLRAAHERLKAQMAELLEAHPTQDNRNPDLHLSLAKLQALTGEIRPCSLGTSFYKVAIGSLKSRRTKHWPTQKIS